MSLPNSYPKVPMDTPFSEPAQPLSLTPQWGQEWAEMRETKALQEVMTNRLRGLLEVWVAGKATPAHQGAAQELQALLDLLDHPERLHNNS